MNQGSDRLLQSVGQDFGNKLHRGVEQGDGSEIIDSSGIINFGDESDVGRVDASEANGPIMESTAQTIKLLFDDRLALLKKFIVETIWPR